MAPIAWREVIFHYILFCFRVGVIAGSIKKVRAFRLGAKMESDRDTYRAAEKVTEAGPGAAPVSGYRGGYGRGSGAL